MADLFVSKSLTWRLCFPWQRSAWGLRISSKARWRRQADVTPPWKAALPGKPAFVPDRRCLKWGDENPPEWRIIFQPGFIPFRSASFRFAVFARTSDFQADRHSGRSARGAGIWALASFRKRGEAECSDSELLESGHSFPGASAFLSRQDAPACGSGIFVAVRRHAAGT